MILSYANNFVFIKGRKVAGTSIEIALSRACGPDDVITPITPVDEALRLDVGRPCQNFCADPEVERAFLACVREGTYQDARRTGAFNVNRVTFVNHTPLRQVEEATGLRTEDFTRIVCERDPYAKVISLANMKLSSRNYDGRPMLNTAEQIKAMVAEIVENGEYERLNNAPLYASDRPYARTVVLRQERLSEDFAALWSTLGLPGRPELPFAKQGASLLGLAPEDVLTGDQIAAINAHFAEEFERFGYRRLPA